MRFFISYSRTVKQQVEPIIRLLEAAGHQAWWDGDIPEIADWWATILDEIERCEVFVCIVSEKSVQSPFCLEELRYATERNRPILPFIIDDHTKYTIPPEVTPIRNQWFVYDGDPARTLQRILDASGKIDRRKYKDIPTLRPPEPGKGSGSLVKEFQQAVTLAEEGHFDEALKRFRSVMSLDYDEWGDDCQQWIERIALYKTVAEYAEHHSTLERARKRWSAYTVKHGTAFDPFDLHDKLRPPRTRVYDIMPPPFEWVEIPAGRVKLIPEYYDDESSYLKRETFFNVPTFMIAKYPVTNAQYAVFINVGGYNQKRWWTDKGWQMRELKNWISPEDWQKSSQKGADYPVFGVSWYEAVAFCRWLSETAGEKISLPTEQQWQCAAQGDDGRLYPWGDAYDYERCNTEESEFRSPTPVTAYPDGASPFGVIDMAGNVSEWCLTEEASGSESEEDDGRRVMRGGGWTNFRDYAKVLTRDDNDPSFRFLSEGFRIVRLSQSSTSGA